MQTILEQAQRTLKMEADAILAMSDRLDEQFIRAIDLLFSCRGRVVVTGMGKSGLISKKIAATLASTGTPAFFLHPAEGGHGDLGMITKEDILITLSNSGETSEVLELLPVVKRFAIPMIAIVGNPNSTLGRMSDAVLDASVAREACPLNLAPTCSSTASLAMGDALAVALLEKRAFNEDQFALFHPGGSLGKKLLLRVEDLMHTREKIPLVAEKDKIKNVILEMTDKRLGMTGVLDQENRLTGIITDGDLRRHLEQDEKLLKRAAKEVMTPNPKAIRPTALAVEAIKMMEKNKISSLFVFEPPVKEDKLIGVIHLHTLLEAGLM
ncbi:KpsF/GutQ family sugar-phosphate isomerase [Magnetococcales bacterium HHB-1]